jgi:hypothetical protein
MKKGFLRGNMVSPEGASEASDMTELAAEPQLAK